MEASLYYNTLETSKVPKEIKLFISEARSSPWIRISADKKGETIEGKLEELKCFRKKRASKNKHSILGWALDIKHKENFSRIYK